MATPIGQLEGKYEILAKIKEGGMGAVYKVRHRLLDEIRVIKLIRPQLESDEGIKARFLGEARKGVKLRHPHIAQFYDFSIDDDGNAFIVMEFIEGASLDEILKRRGPLSIGLTLEVAQQSLSALAYLHKRAIVHRDISPDNLMLGKDEEGHPLVRLIDLGIAKMLVGESGLTQAGTFLGKVRYASPEQFRAQEGIGVDFRSDVYSFGIVLYEILTGTHPIPGDSLSSAIAGHLFNPPLSFDKSDPEGRVPGDLRALVLHALEKQPDRRLQSAAGFAKELARIRERYSIPAQELDNALEACLFRDEKTERIQRPSSTQERLNREFGLHSTPRPATAGSPETVETPAPVPSVADLQTSIPEPGAYPRSEPDRAAAYQAEIERRSKAIVERLAGIDAAIGEGAYEKASAAIEEAAAAYGSLEALEDLRRRLAAHRRDAVSSRLAEVIVLLEGDRFREALIKIDDAHRLDPTDERVAEARRRAADAQRTYEQAKQRQRAIGEASREVEMLLAGGDVVGAQARLDEARASLGESPELDALRVRIEAERAKQRAAKLSALLEESSALLASASFGQALAKLQEAGQVDPTDRRVHDLFAQVRAAQRAHEEAEQRSRAVADTVRRVEALLKANDPDRAQARIDEARRSLGAAPEFDALGRRVDEERARQRAAAVSALLEQARGLRGVGKFKQALGKLQEAARVDPANPAIAELGAAINAEQHSRDEAEERRRAIASESRRIEKLLRSSQLDGAEQALGAALSALGSSPELEALKGRLAGARAEERRAARKALLDRARALAKQDKFAEAAGLLEGELATGPDDAVASLLAELRTTAAHREAERERSLAAAALVRALDGLIGEGKLQAALLKLDTEGPALGETEELRAVRRRISERRAARTALFDRARALAKQDRYTEAIELLERELAAESDDAGASLLTETRTAAARHDAELERSRAVNALVAAVDALVGEGKLEAALLKLDREGAKLGDAEELRAVRRRISERQQAERAAEARRLAQRRETTVADDSTAPVLRAPTPPAAPAAPPRMPPAAAAEPTVPVEAPRPRPAKPPLAERQARAAAPPQPTRRRVLPSWVWIGSAALLIGIVAVGLWLFRGRQATTAPPETVAATPAPPTGKERGAVTAEGLLVLDALPWGEVTKIEDERGAPVGVPPGRYTPLAVPLPPGRYRVTIRHPDFPAPIVVVGEVRAGQATRAVAEFRKANADELLARFGW